MVQVAALLARELDAFFQQQLVNVDDPAARENLVEFVALQLVETGAATHHHGLDVQVVQRVRDSVEQNPVVGDDFLGLVEVARTALGITAAQVTGRQHRLHPGMPEHGLGRQADLAEQSLGAAAGEVEHCLGLGTGALRVADDGDVVLVLDVQQRPGRSLGQSTGHLLVDEVDHLLLHRGGAHRGRWTRRLPVCRDPQDLVGQTLRLVADAHHRRTHQLDRLRAGGVQEEHRGRVAGPERLLPHLAQQVAHVHGDIAEVDLHRAGRMAAVADGAVVRHILEFLPVLDRNAPTRLLFVEKGLDQQRRRKDLVAWAVQQVRARHVGRAHRLALAATQAVLDAVGDGADVRLLHDQRLVAHQPEAGRVGMFQVGRVHRCAWLAGNRLAQQLALVETPLRVHPPLVVGEGLEFRVTQEFELGDPDAVLARDHPVQAARQDHDALDRLVGRLEHLVVVAVDRDVGVHVAVAGVHVQRHPDPPLEHPLVDGDAFVQDRLEGRAGEDRHQPRTNLGLPAGTQAVVLEPGEQRVHIRQPALPERAGLVDHRQRLAHPVFQQLGRGDPRRLVLPAQGQIAPAEEGLQLVAQGNLVAQAELDVDALDAVGVFGHARQGNHHVFVDLEGVGVAADRGGALAVEPELLARLGANRDEALAGARIGDADHLAGGAGHGIGIVTGDVADQHHLGQAPALALGGVADRLQVAVVQMLQAGQEGAGALLLGKHEILDFHDAGHRIACIAEEFQADRSRMRRHAVNHPTRTGDQAVTTLLLHTGQAGQELVGHVLAKSFLAEGGARDVQPLGLQQLAATGVKGLELKAGELDIMNLAQVVVQPCDFEPLGVRRHHPPAGQVVQRGAPQYRLLATRVHRDVAADARGLGRGGIDREHIAGPLGRIGNALGHHPGLGPDRGDRRIDAGQGHHLDLGHRFELFGVDDRRLPGQRNRTTRVTRAATARHDGQAELDAAFDQAGHFGLGVRCQHHKRVFDAPVGGVGHVADAGKAVELDVVLGRQAPQRALGLLSKRRNALERRVEGGNRLAGGPEQFGHQRIPLPIGLGCAPFLDFAQPVVQCFDQGLATGRVVQQIVLQIGVALDHPDVAQHLVQHARRAAGAALFAQPVQQLPGAFAEQADHDLAIGERGVVVGNLAQSRRFCGGSQLGNRNGCVHR